MGHWGVLRQYNRGFGGARAGRGCSRHLSAAPAPRARPYPAPAL